MLGGREPGGGRFSNPPTEFDLSPFYYISCRGTPIAGIAQLEGSSRSYNGRGACSCSPFADPTTYGGSRVTAIYCGGGTPTATHVTERPISRPPSPGQGAYIQHVDGMPYLIRPSRGGTSGGTSFQEGGGRIHLL